MPDHAIHGIRTAYSASAALRALGDALGQIKQQDALTWADIGAVLGKSEDQAAKYAEGTATMDFITFGRGKMHWGSRFSGPFDRLCIEAGLGDLSDHIIQSTVIRASLAIAEAQANNGTIDDWEIIACRPAIEAARDALEALLRRAGT